MTRSVHHYYVYSRRDYRYVYERTCGTEEAAEDWVKYYGKGAVYLLDHLITGAFY